MVEYNSKDENNEYPVNENTKRGKSYRLLLLFIILLLIFNAFLLYQFINQKSQKEEYQEELVSTIDLKVELEKEIAEYEARVAKYEDLIDENDSSLIASQAEIEEKVKEIKRLIKKGNITRRQYEEAQKELKVLRYYTKKYQNQIQALTEENRLLSHENIGLKKDIKVKKKEIDHLTDENVLLSNKVSLGAKLVTNQLMVTGIQIKNNGKKKETLKGSRMTGLKIIFTLNNNIIAKRGPRVFFIKILTPRGETLYIESTGSGVFNYQGGESLYTVSENLDFNNDPSKVYTVYWAKGSPFEKGAYKAELFCEGQILGKKSFVIK